MSTPPHSSETPTNARHALMFHVDISYIYHKRKTLFLSTEASFMFMTWFKSWILCAFDFFFLFPFLTVDLLLAHLLIIWLMTLHLIRVCKVLLPKDHWFFSNTFPHKKCSALVYIIRVVHRSLTRHYTTPLSTDATTLSTNIPLCI